jgi:hypothetical protein
MSNRQWRIQDRHASYVCHLEKSLIIMVQSLLTSSQMYENTSWSRALAPGLSPGSWELACGNGRQEYIEATIRGKTVHTLLDTRWLFDLTLFVCDVSLLSFKGL